MEKAEKLRQEVLTRMAEMFELPADLVAGLPHMEILGNREFFLDGHEGILSYGTEQIDVNTGGAVLRIRGSNLTLRSMTENELRINGKILGLEWLY